MKELASSILATIARRGVAYADVRVINDRTRALATKNGKIGNAAESESAGFNVRVLVDGAWGFAASADFRRESVEATAKRALEIAKASAKVKHGEVRLAAEKPVSSE